MKLKGKTLKGKNRIREFGEDWSLIRTSDTVLFDQRNGPWGLIRPVNPQFIDQERWIHLTNDQNFDIVSM